MLTNKGWISNVLHFVLDDPITSVPNLANVDIQVPVSVRPNHYIDDTWVIDAPDTTPINYDLTPYWTWDDFTQTQYHLQVYDGSTAQTLYNVDTTLNYTDGWIDLVHNEDGSLF